MLAITSMEQKNRIVCASVVSNLRMYWHSDDFQEQMSDEFKIFFFVVVLYNLPSHSAMDSIVV